MRGPLRLIVALLLLALAAPAPARERRRAEEAEERQWWLVASGPAARPDAALNQWADHTVLWVDEANHSARPLFTLDDCECLGWAGGACWFFAPARLVDGKPTACLWSWDPAALRLQARELALPRDPVPRPLGGAAADALLFPCGWVAEEDGRPAWWSASPTLGPAESWPGCRAALAGETAEARAWPQAPALPQVQGRDAADNAAGAAPSDRWLRFSARLDDDGRVRRLRVASLLGWPEAEVRLSKACDLSAYRADDPELEVWAFAADHGPDGPRLVVACGRRAGGTAKPLGYHLWSEAERRWIRIGAEEINGGRFVDYPALLYPLDDAVVWEGPPPADLKPGDPAARWSARVLAADGRWSDAIALPRRSPPLAVRGERLLLAEGDELVWRSADAAPQLLAKLPAAPERVQAWSVVGPAPEGLDAPDGLPEPWKRGLRWVWGNGQ